MFVFPIPSTSYMWFIWSKWMQTIHAKMEVSYDGGTPKSSILVGVSVLNHPFWGIHILRTPPDDLDHTAMVIQLPGGLYTYNQ